MFYLLGRNWMSPMLSSACWCWRAEVSIKICDLIWNNHHVVASVFASSFTVCSASTNVWCLCCICSSCVVYLLCDGATSGINISKNTGGIVTISLKFDGIVTVLVSITLHVKVLVSVNIEGTSLSLSKLGVEWWWISVR